MRRLVYSPKVYAYLKTDATRNIGPDAYVDISDFISAGQVSRVTGAASQFSLTVRNPYRLWTQPDPATISLLTCEAGQSAVFDQIAASPGEPVFHPMDTITIWGSRFNNRPIQLFTGYLDSSPYLQLYPGAITLTGSCTLKRIIYTYWDPGLPMVLQWLYKYGWYADPSTGTVSNIPGALGGLSVAQAKGQLNDGSVANLVYGLLHDIGDWDDSEILIEELPPGIIEAVNAIYRVVASDNTLAETELKQFLQTAIGSGGYGSGSGGSASNSSGGTASGAVAGAAQIVATVQPIAAKYNIPLELPLAVMYIETGFHNQDTSGNPHYGWFQCQLGGCYAYGPWAHGGYTIADTHDLGLAATAFCAAAQGWANADSSLKNDLQGWAMKVQGVNLGNNPYYGTGWPSATATAQSYIAKYAKGGSASNVQSTTGGGTTIIAGNKNQKPNATSGTGGAYVSPFQKCQITGYQRTDMGVDQDLGPVGADIVAIGNGTVLGVSEPGWPGPGGFMWYRLDDGPNQGAIIYYAEGIAPTVANGAKVSAGQPIATVADQSSGTEFGYCDAGGTTLAAGHYTEGAVTEEGKRFARFLRSLGVNTQMDPGPGDASWAGNGSLTMNGKVNGTLSGQATGGNSSAGGGSSGTGGLTGGGNILGDATAAAFAVSISLPGLAGEEESILLTGQKSLMNDVSLMPFTQQVVSASMRTFQSLPDGTFFAFFPDYFGEYALLAGKGGPYWEIDDIEIIDGKIQLSDDALATHVYVVGDTIGSFGQYGASTQLINQIMSGGVMTIFDAFESGFVNLGNQGQNAQLKGKVNAIEFLKRYGARPYINQDASFVRNPQFEAFIAFQTFQLMWARQFQTNFSFTFMPELFPGGRCGFPAHGFQTYIDSVTHNFDYQSGFTTDATLEAPSVMPGVTDNIGVSKGLVRGQLALTVTSPTPSTKPKGGPTKSGRKL